MIRIEDDKCIDALLNSDGDVSQARMSNSNENEATIPEVVEVQTDDSSNTSMNDSSLSDSGESSGETSISGEGKVDVGEDEANTEVEEILSAIPLSTPSASIPVAVAQASIRQPTSFENLTVPVATPINPPTSSTSYAGVTSTIFQFTTW